MVPVIRSFETPCFKGPWFAAGKVRLKRDGSCHGAGKPGGDGVLSTGGRLVPCGKGGGSGCCGKLQRSSHPRLESLVGHGPCHPFVSLCGKQVCIEELFHAMLTPKLFPPGQGIMQEY